MPDSRRAWTDDDIARLKSLAGKLPVKDVAAQLGRTPGATVVEASKLRLSLRVRSQKRTDVDEATANP